jgi:DNA-binding beta-propeller fold protein YncE
MRLVVPSLAPLAFLVCACSAAAPAPQPTAGSAPLPASAASAPVATGAAKFTVTPVALPGSTGSVGLDYLAIDRATGHVFVPAGETASVDVIDGASLQVTRIEGFATAERESRGGKRVVGPSSATIGEGFAYVGNRANYDICEVSLAKLAKGACLGLPSSPDGLQYIAATKEVWATTPRDKSITVLDASTPGKLAIKTKITFDGAPEGYAIDATRGVFYTNLEDTNKTVVVDVRAHKITATWEPRCGADGPRGLAVDAAKGFLFVACTDQIKVLDAAHGGAELSSLPVGGGVDNIDYLDARGELFVAAGKTGALVVAHVDDKGALTILGTAVTSPGTRVVVAAADGSAFVADGKLGRVLAVKRAP